MSEPPMPTRIELAATVRDLGTQEIPVARVHFVDVTGDVRAMDFDETVALDLAVELLTFCRQVRQ